MLPFKTRRTSQPQGAVEIDFGNSITRGLSAVNNSAVSRVPLNSAGRLTPVKAGLAISGQISNGGAAGTSTGWEGTWTQGTVLAVFVNTANTDTCLIAGLTDGVNETGFGVGIQSYSGGRGIFGKASLTNYKTLSANQYSSVLPAAGDGALYSLLFRFNSVENTCGLYFRGILNVSNSSNTTGETLVNTGASWINLSVSGASSSTGKDVLLVVYWNRALSDAEIKSISDNPWQIFKPQSRSLWIPGTVSGGGTTSATVTQSDSADTTSLNATVTTGATIASSEDADTQAVAAANWMTAQLSSSDGADTQSVAVTVGGITLAGIAQSDGGDATAITMANWTAALIAHGDAPDTTTVTGNIVGVTSASVATVDAADAQALTTLVTTGAVIVGTDGADAALVSAACWTTAIMAAVNGADTTNIVGSIPGTAVYPLESQVQAGVQYGPTGADYTGTLTGGSGPSAADIAAAVWSYTQ